MPVTIGGLGFVLCSCFSCGFRRDKSPSNCWETFFGSLFPRIEHAKRNFRTVFVCNVSHGWSKRWQRWKVGDLQLSMQGSFWSGSEKSMYPWWCARMADLVYMFRATTGNPTCFKHVQLWLQANWEGKAGTRTPFHFRRVPTKKKRPKITGI